MSSTFNYESVAASSAHRSPIRELMWLALPTILQMLAYTVEQFTDAYMLSKVSDLHATAAGNAGMVVFAVISFGFGVLMLVNAMVSESYGAKKFGEAGPHLWQGIWFALIYSVLMVPLMFCAPMIFRWMGHDSELVPLEVSYFNVSVALLVVKMLAIAVGQFMLAVNRPMVVFWAATAGMFVNIFLNWLLIYGNWGLPQLGVAGAAWGTNGAVLTELLIVFAVAMTPAMRTKYRVLAARLERSKFKELLRIGIPSGFQTMGDVIAWTIFLAAVMAMFGTAAQAANIYMLQFMKLSFMPAFGLSTAVTALVARYIGAGQPDVSEHRAHLGFKVAAVYMATCGVVFFIFRHEFMSFFSSDPEVIRIGALLFAFCAVFQFFDAMFVIYIGALRGVKDTFVPAIVQTALCWVLIVGGGFGVAYWKPEWGVAGPWTVGCIYCCVLGLYLNLRFRGGHWRKRLPELSHDHTVEMYAAEATSR
jgi:multidrug resistance protein, MATE family